MQLVSCNADGVLYTGSYDRYLYAIDAFDGTLIWKYSMSPDSDQWIICSSPTVSNGVVYAGYGRFVYPGTGALIALNCTTGTKIWNYSVPGYVLTVPAVENGIVYAGTYGISGAPGGSNDYYVFAVNSTTGALLWTFRDQMTSFTSSPAIANGLVYIGSLGGGLSSKIYALDAQSGGFVWSHELPNQTSSSPAVANNIVYIGSGNGSIHAFDALTGTQIWSYKTGGSIISSPAISNGVVCIGSSDGYLYAFDATTGANRWKYAANGRISSSPAILNGKIYFISDNSTFIFSGSGGVYSGNSTIYALYATPLIEPDLAVSCASSMSYTGFHVTINGTLTANGIGASSAPIQITYSNSGGATWQSLTHVITDSDGKFTVDWLPFASGNYVINATFTGNLTHSSVSTIVNLAVMPYQSENADFVFSVASNSTVTDLAFNSTSRQLSFTVSGLSGTMGYTDISIPKSLINDISTLTISIDNNQVVYTAVSDQDSWLIHLSYHHSAHVVTISLDSTQQDLNPSPTPTSNPSPAPTTTTNQQTSSKTSTPSPTATPTIPELPISLILPLFLVISLIASVIYGKQKSINSINK